VKFITYLLEAQPGCIGEHSLGVSGSTAWVYPLFDYGSLAWLRYFSATHCIPAITSLLSADVTFSPELLRIADLRTGTEVIVRKLISKQSSVTFPVEVIIQGER